MTDLDKEKRLRKKIRHERIWLMAYFVISIAEQAYWFALGILIFGVFSISRLFSAYSKIEPETYEAGQKAGRYSFLIVFSLICVGLAAQYFLNLPQQMIDYLPITVAIIWITYYFIRYRKFYREAQQKIAQRKVREADSQESGSCRSKLHPPPSASRTPPP